MTSPELMRKYADILEEELKDAQRDIDKDRDQKDEVDGMGKDDEDDKEENLPPWANLNQASWIKNLNKKDDVSEAKGPGTVKLTDKEKKELEVNKEIPDSPAAMRKAAKDFDERTAGEARQAARKAQQ